MSSFFGSIFNIAAQLGLVKPTGSEFALLVVLGAFLLALRTFREGYLKIWTVGWIAFVASRLAGHVFLAQIPQHYVPVAEQAGFVLAVGLLAAAVYAYIRSRDLLLTLAVVTPILIGFAVARLLFRIHSRSEWHWKSDTESSCSVPRSRCSVRAGDGGNLDHGCWR